VDEETHAEICAPSATGTILTSSLKATKSPFSGGHGFCGIARIKLLQILQQRAAGLGVKLVFQTESPILMTTRLKYDLVIASDGASSITRRKYEHVFKPNIQVRRNRFVWLGSRRKLDAFTSTQRN